MSKIKGLVNKRSLLIPILALAVLGGGFVGYLRYYASPDLPADVNLEPPSESDKQEAERHKEELAKQPAPHPQPKPSKPKAVTPVVTSWGQTDENFELAARVPGIFEDGGTCELTLAKGSQTVRSTSSGIENVSEVSCGFIKIPLSRLTAGTWSAVVSYTSDTARGTSQVVQVTVK